MKQFFCIVCALALLLGLVACQPKEVGLDNETNGDSSAYEATTQGEELQKPMAPVTYPLNANTKGIKILGERYLASNTQINCDWSGSGIEMDIQHTGGDIVFQASATKSCYFRVYIDGKEWESPLKSPYYTVGSSKTKIQIKGVPAGDHRIKLIKVTGYTLARAQIYDVTFGGTIKETAPAKNDLYIEFVGDSICCGWGTIGAKAGAYTDQDATLAYPLQVAEALNADYAVTALSGKGLIYGDIEVMTGYQYASLLRTKDEPYAFERKADIVVINIGTNDYSKRTTANITAADFEAAYLQFIRMIHEKNGPDCKIYCLYNCINDTFVDAIKAAVKEYGGSSKNVYTFKMERRGNASGNGHPNIAEHEAYTKTLIDLLQGKIDADPEAVALSNAQATPTATMPLTQCVESKKQD